MQIDKLTDKEQLILDFLKDNKVDISEVIDVIIRKKIISKGWSIFRSMKKEEVKIISVPRNIDLLAVAPTKPIIISTAEIGAACNSNIVPLNLGKNILNEPLEILCVNIFNIKRPGTIYMP